MSQSQQRNRMKLGCLAGILLLIGFLTVPLVTIKNRVDFKHHSPHENQHILESELRQVEPEAQMEDDTCGLHTLRTIYKAYGIDPDHENLSTRLGLKVPSNPIDETSTGTLQFDMVGVLIQDGFDFRFLDLDSPNVAAELLKHLNSTNMAAMLIRRRQTGNLHWVAATAGTNGSISIIDSLAEAPYPEHPQDFLQSCTLSCILVSPSREPSSPAAIRRGEYYAVLDMVQTVKRYKKMNAGKD